MRASLLSIFTLLALQVATAVAEVSVASRLTHRSVPVGRTVQLQVEVSGAGEEVRPPEIAVDGLDIRYVGPSTSRQIQFDNGRVTQEVKTIFLYQIVPEKEGDFTIPAVTLNVGGRNYRTQPVGLKVQKSSNPPSGSDSDSGDKARAFAEIEVGKKVAYIGEVIPVEVRLLVDSRVRIEDVAQMPDLTGDGFTMQKFPRFEQTIETRNGREYRVLVFRTAMTPTKAGKLTIGPSDIPFVAQVPRQRRNNARSLFDSIFGDDVFDPFGAFAERRRYDARANAVELEVKPLPTEGRPESFSGAVGNFKFTAQGSPGQVKIGEPVTMRLRVTGVGNFDRMEAPKLVEEDGWQTYDASANFEPTDELKTSGTKTFEIPVVPETRHNQMPQFEFSYFDPADGRYKALRSDPAPLVVHGEPLVAQATPAPAPAAIPDAAPETPGQSAADIVGLHYVEGPRRNFDPVYKHPAFLALNGAAAVVALALVGSRLFHREPTQARSAALRRQRDDLLRRLASTSGDDFYEQAIRVIQLQAGMSGAVEPASVDADTARRVCKLDAETANEVQAIFDARAERIYAGSNVAAEVSQAERAKVIATLERFCRS